MTTLAGLRGIVRERLADETQWPDDTLDQWIEDAIADYSVYFPRRLTAIIECVTDQVEYSLSALTDPQAVISVEYPDGEDPMSFLVWRPREGVKDFWGGDYYDVWGIHKPETLILGSKPATGEDIVVGYTADHLYPTADDNVLTVLNRHLEGLVLFVWWKAAQELLAAEAQDPQTTTLLLTQFDMLVYRAGREYRAWRNYVMSERNQRRWLEDKERRAWEALRLGVS